MRPRLFLVAWLTVVWLALWRDVTFGNITSGVVLAAVVVGLFPPENAARVVIRPVAMVRFVGATAMSIVRANVVVAWEVVTPSNRINEGVVAVELRSNDPVVITNVSNAIILAPGTMVVDIERGDGDRPTILYVHVLHLRRIEDVRRDVQRLEALARAAVSDRTGDEARRGVDR